MLTRVAVTLVVLVALTIPGGIASGDGGCVKNPVTGKCFARGDIPPVPPGGGGGGGGGGPGGDPCGYEMLEPQPPASDPVWGGVDPAKADIYWKYCPDAAPVQIRVAPGIGALLPPPMDPAVLAGQIIASMAFTGPQIRTAPPQGADSGLVGLGIWMWAEPSPTTTGRLSDSDSEGGVSVSVTGVVTSIRWDMGDGGSVTCGLGTPYPGGGFDGESPDCGYTYATASTNHVAGGGPWPLTATSTWTITWSGGGEAGTEIIELSSTGELLISELYVLNQDAGG